MKILTVVGARPQFIKCAPVSEELRKTHTEVLVHTGQHYDAGMSDVFFDELAIPAPDHHLGIGSGGHGEQTGRMLAALEAVMVAEAPDMVLVYGDTNSTLAGALAAAKLHIPVAHVEAGLRSFDRAMPEEINRVVADHISTLLFCPTDAAAGHLSCEGIEDGVYVTGDVMADSLLRNRKRAEEKAAEVLRKHGLSEGGYYCATVHRPANTDDPASLSSILRAFGRLDAPVLFPLHPRTKKALESSGLDSKTPPNVILSPPLSYLEMVGAMAHARKVLTDSGGVQKEAYILGIPCVTMRDTTEWTETIDAGWNVLAGADEEAIVRNALAPVPPKTPRPPLYGDGHAAEKIATAIDYFLKKKE